MSNLISSGQTKKFLKNILVEREENLVRLYFDKCFTKVTYPGEKEEEFKKLEIEILRIEKEIDKERVKSKKLRNLEGIIEFEGKLKGVPGEIGLKQKADELKSKLDMVKQQMEKIGINIKVEEQLIKSLRGYIENPEKIYENNNRSH